MQDWRDDIQSLQETLPFNIAYLLIMYPQSRLWIIHVSMEPVGDVGGPFFEYAFFGHIPRDHFSKQAILKNV